MKMFISICHYYNCHCCLPFTAFVSGCHLQEEKSPTQFSYSGIFAALAIQIKMREREMVVAAEWDERWITMKHSFKLSTKLRWNDCHSNLFWPNYEDCKNCFRLHLHNRKKLWRVRKTLFVPEVFLLNSSRLGMIFSRHISAWPHHIV